jgi:hypothetical protein
MEYCAAALTIIILIVKIGNGLYGKASGYIDSNYRNIDEPQKNKL